MRDVALSALVLLSGCFYLPSGSGPQSFDKQSGALSVCTPVDHGFSKGSLEGQWQDWGGTFQVYEFQDGQVTVSSVDDEGKASRQIAGKYRADPESVTITWDDGATESASTYIESSPGCEMMAFADVKGSSPRLSPQQSFERVRCDFNGDSNATNAPVQVK